MPPGGDYYDRDVYSAPSSSSSSSSRSSSSTTSFRSSSTNYSSYSNAVMSQTRTLQKSCDPSRYKEEMLVSEHKNPIVFCLDITGSMGNFSKTIYDKLPMFYGEMMSKKYVEDPGICFAGIGDAGKGDKGPLQVTDFGQGKEIDQMISKLWLEGGGGGNHMESYGLCTYFFLSRCDISKCSKLPFFFITGDEGFFPKIKKGWINRWMKTGMKNDVDSEKVFREIRKKFMGNVYLLKKKYYDSNREVRITEKWKEVLGEEHVIHLTDAKSIVDIVLGIIAVVSGQRTLSQYLDDMRSRGQDRNRLTLVSQALKNVKKNKFLSTNNNNNNNEDEGEVEEEEEDPVFLERPSGYHYEYKPSSVLIKRKIEAHSYGIVPVRRLSENNNQMEVLILQHENGEHWDFPKGHGQKNETGKKAAERELFEETNLKVEKYLTHKEYLKKYVITKYEDADIHKTVHWFVALVSCSGDEKLKLEEKEILDHRWVKVEDVKKLLTHESQQNLFEAILKDNVLE